MAHLVNRLQPLADSIGIGRRVTENTHYGSMALWTYPPHVQVSDFGITRLLDQRANLLRDMIISVVQQNPSGGAHQAPCPPGDDNGPNDAHGRVKPSPAEIAPREQGGNGEHGNERIGNHVTVGGLEVVIVPVNAMGVAMIIVVTMTEQQRTDYIDRQANDSDQGGCTELNLTRL